MVVTESDLPVLISTHKLSHSWSSCSLSPSSQGGERVSNWWELGCQPWPSHHTWIPNISHGQILNHVQGTGNYSTYGNLSDRDGSWCPLITRLRAMPPPLLNCLAAPNSFMRKCSVSWVLQNFCQHIWLPSWDRKCSIAKHPWKIVELCSVAVMTSIANKTKRNKFWEVKKKNL